MMAMRSDGDRQAIMDGIRKAQENGTWHMKRKVGRVGALMSNGDRWCYDRARRVACGWCSKGTKCTGGCPPIARHECLHFVTVVQSLEVAYVRGMEDARRIISAPVEANP